MMDITRCGNCCNLCKAFAPNVKKNDQREELSKVWNEYYNVDIPVDNIYCEGCRCEKENGKLIDISCPTRMCVIDKKLNHCGDCSKYPCSTFNERKGLSAREAEEKSGENYDFSKYNEYLLAYDNKSRIDEYKKNNF
jgi:hypothetical protein